MDKKYQVFVSSTYEDLQEERKKVMEALLQMNCFPVGMEYFNASDDSQWEVIKNLIDECDYYVLLVAGRYGSVDQATGISYTQKEYEYAVSIGVPVISFLHKSPESLPGTKIESDATSKEKLEQFKCDIQKRLCKYWENSDGLASQVVLSLNSLIKSKPRTGWVKADKALTSEASGEILRLRKQIDDLSDKIKQLEENSPEGSELLAQGDEKLEVRYTDYYNSVYKKSLSWNYLISLLSPHMISECSEVDLKKAINNNLGLYVREADTPVTITEDSFQTIKVQLLALGIISESTKVHSAANTNVYWSLTPWGRKQMMTLKAIKKEKPV